MHDFDFLLGRWMVQHRRLKSRLTHCVDWESFAGTCEARPILGGQGNVDDNVLALPDGLYRASSIRIFNPATGDWAIWWFDARYPTKLDPPVIGSFQDGVGTFYSDDQWNGCPIRVRYLWSDITAAAARWQQAFSGDGGNNWETNWVMEFRRTSSH